MEGMLKELGEKKLFDAAAEGNAIAFSGLLQQHPLLLTKVSFALSHKNPLHIATMQQNWQIVGQILHNNPQLAEELDSQKSSPLHIAAANGNVQIASALLSRAPNMCWSRDWRGMNPIHVAAMNGRDVVLEKLVEKVPFAAMEKLDRGETVLHLCVKHRRPKALEVLVKKLPNLDFAEDDDGTNLVQNLGDFVCAEDDDGETVLHLAVRYRQVKMVRYLMSNTLIDNNSKNSKGQTPLEILKQGISYSGPDNATEKIKKILSRGNQYSRHSQTASMEWITQRRDAIMVVAILIATMAFQAAVSPTGGVWQEESNGHRDGEAVMAFNNPKTYKNFIRTNTVAFVTSLSTILLLIGGIPLNNRFSIWALMTTMWVSVTAVGVTYGASIMVVTPEIHSQSLSQIIQTGIVVWSLVMGTLLIWNTIRLLHWSLHVRNRRYRIWSLQVRNTIDDRIDAASENSINLFKSIIRN